MFNGNQLTASADGFEGYFPTDYALPPRLHWVNECRGGSARPIMIRIYNVEADLPTLDQARRLVIEEIRRAKRDRVRVLKIIHGYGSSGTGGRLAVGLRKSFALRKKEGAILDAIPGEDFSIFQPRTMALLEAVPKLKGDLDLNQVNEGITIVWLK